MRIRNVFKILLVNVCLTLVGVEFVCLVFYYYENETFFYSRPRAQADPGDNDAPAERELLRLFHPYLGFIRRPGSELYRGRDVFLHRLYGTSAGTPWEGIETNNLGFFSVWDYPYIPTEDDTFIVAMLGGSVTKYFCLSGADQLAVQLKDLGFARDKKIIILNMAQGGFKQPQQLNILSYLFSMGQRVDLVINIDGYNEAALGGMNHEKGIDAAMPDSSVFLPLVALVDVTTGNRNTLVIFGDIERSRNRLAKIEMLQNRTLSAATYFGLGFVHRYFQSQLEKYVSAIEQKPLTQDSSLIFVRRATDDSNVREHSAEIWAESSLIMHQILSARDIPYVHVLQPNQYFSNHPFSSEERRIALNDNDLYAKHLREGYPYLLEKIAYLRDNGVNVVNAVNIYDEEDRIVFADNCCHLNHLGNALLADAIAQGALPVLDPR